MTEDLSSRFDANVYENDEPVHVFRCDIYGPPKNDLWIPERLWHRLRMLGSAYFLHLLPVLVGPEPIFLNRLQVEQLNSELVFVGEAVDDPLVVSQVQALLALSSVASQGASKSMLAIEFP